MGDGGQETEYKGVRNFHLLSSPDIQADWHRKTYVPITKAAYELTKKQAYETNPGTDIAIQQLLLKNPTKIPRAYAWAISQIRASSTRSGIGVAQKKSPKQALDDAVERGNAELRKFERAIRRAGAEPRWAEQDERPLGPFVIPHGKRTQFPVGWLP